MGKLYLNIFEWIQVPALMCVSATPLLNRDKGVFKRVTGVCSVDYALCSVDYALCSVDPPGSSLVFDGWNVWTGVEGSVSIALH